MKYVYPACFYKEEDGRYSVSFPDLGIATYGDNIADAMEMAADAVAGWVLESLEHGDKIPMPSALDEVKADEQPGGFVSLVYTDIDRHKANHEEKPVKKTLTIPSWLNQAAEKKNINFSATLKEALIEKLAQ
ncbi:MAG: type II toxin-antitoxin system HicB family antitoxin [Oscillospiraceae bacterium]